MERNLRKTRIGEVVSDKMDKTIVVAVKTKKKHALYSKTVNFTSKIKAHDETTSAALAISLRLWRPVRSLKTRDGDSSRSSRKLNKEEAAI